MMRLDGSKLKAITLAGGMLSLIGGWAALSGTATMLGALILAVGLFLFFFGRRGSILIMEKEVFGRRRSQ